MFISKGLLMEHEELFRKFDLITESVDMLRFTADALKNKDAEDGSIAIIVSATSQISMATKLLEQHIHRVLKETTKIKEEHANLLKQYDGVLFDVEAKQRGYVKAD